jgi:predicted dehydrogenase
MSLATRRSFFQQSAAIGLGLTTALTGRAVAANDKISVACIGVRGRGNSVMQSFAAEPDCAVTHICDVNESVRAQRGAEMKEKTGRMPDLVKDYRTLLDNPSVDVLMVATPDHWHALPTIHGCLADKDVYVEKPASHNILEGKTAVAAARKCDRIVQVGTQIRSAPFLKDAVAYVASGALGKVLYGRAWETNRNGEVRLGPDGTAPADLDYDLWQGPAPARPYNATIVGGAWRWLFDYGTGDLGNDGVHRIDYCRFLMGLDDMPQTICTAGGKLFFDDDQQWPDTQLVTFEFPGKILQYEMRLWSRPRLFDVTEGAAVYGENGWILLTNNAWKAYDAAGKLAKEGTGESGQTQRLHIRNFLDAVRSRDRATLNQEVSSGHISSVMCHAGNISWRTGKKLRFDARTETFDDAEANQYVGREHRKGFELPVVAYDQ